MSRHRKDPLRPLTPDERIALTRLSRSPSAPAAQVARARALLAIADGASYTAAAHQIGRRHTETISAWVSRFNRAGLAAVQPRHGGGPRLCYGIDEQQRILAEMARTPEREQDGTATWSLSLLQKALRQAPDGLPRVSTFTIWRTLHEAGLSWQKSRTWCETGGATRHRKHGVVRVSDPDAAAKKADRAGLHTGRARPTHGARSLGSRSGARTTLGRFRPCRIPARRGSRANTRPSNRTTPSAVAQPRS
jgi:transposase